MRVKEQPDGKWVSWKKAEDIVLSTERHDPYTLNAKFRVDLPTVFEGETRYVWVSLGDLQSVYADKWLNEHDLIFRIIGRKVMLLSIHKEEQWQ